jgi:hypothetical protein
MARDRARLTPGTIVALLAAVLLLLFCPNPWAVLEERATFVCVTRERALAEALTMYAVENDGSLPSSAAWPQAVRPYLKGDSSPLNCPSRRRAGEATYAVRGDRKLGDHPPSDLDADIYQVLLHEVRSGVPASPHRTCPRSLWAYREWRQGKPGLDRRPDSYMWVTYDDGHYAAKAELTRETLRTGYDPEPW